MVESVRCARGNQSNPSNPILTVQSFIKHLNMRRAAQSISPNCTTFLLLDCESALGQTQEWRAQDSQQSGGELSPRTCHHNQTRIHSRKPRLPYHLPFITHLSVPSPPVEDIIPSKTPTPRESTLRYVMFGDLSRVWGIGTKVSCDCCCVVLLGDVRLVTSEVLVTNWGTIRFVTVAFFRGGDLRAHCRKYTAPSIASVATVAIPLTMKKSPVPPTTEIEGNLTVVDIESLRITDRLRVKIVVEKVAFPALVPLSRPTSTDNAKLTRSQCVTKRSNRNLFRVVDSVSPKPRAWVLPVVTSKVTTSDMVCGFVSGLLTLSPTRACPRGGRWAREGLLRGSRFRYRDDRCKLGRLLVLFLLVGNAVCIMGLKKKMVFIGEKDSCAMYVTTEKAALLTSVLIPKEFSRKGSKIRGCGELGSYCGIVTGFYMQGMVVELDEKVWLLLTDQLFAPSHALRIGAFVSITNVHFVHPKFSWTKTLILGACFKTNISVRSFSPFVSQFHVKSHEKSLLTSMLGSLLFSARLWVLLTISCFKKKFAGMFSEKRILGSKNTEGLVQMYTKSYLPSCMFQQPHGVFMEFCQHNPRGCGFEPNCNPLKLVVPMSNFISHCEAIWKTLLFRNQNDSQSTNLVDLHLCGEAPHPRFIRRIISSEELGICLVGNLQISPSSGRLQLIDASGSLDVVVPDMLSNCNASILYEVRHFSVVIEGSMTEVGVSSSMNTYEALSCRSIFGHSLPNGVIKPSAIFVHFYLGATTSLNVHLHLPLIDWSDDSVGMKNGHFCMLLVTHKFHPTQNFLSDPSVNKSSLFAEAIVLPWDLSIPGKNCDTDGLGVFSDEVDEHLEHVHGRNYSEHLCKKRIKVASRHTATLITELNDDNFTSSHEIQCSVHFRKFNDIRLARQGVLHRVVKKPIGQKAVLEFKPEVYVNFQLLIVGGYYIMKYCNDGFLDHIDGHGRVSFVTSVTSQTQLWRLSFSSDGVQSISGLLKDHSLIASTSNDDVSSSSKNELFFQRCTSQSSDYCSDVNLHLSAGAMKLMNKDLELYDDEKPFAMSGHMADALTCIGNWMSSGPSNPYCKLPQGNLISFCGDVVDVHNFNCCAFDINSHMTCDGSGNFHDSKLFQGIFCGICIHISEDSHIVRLRGTLISHAYPIGIGAGVHATFHRVLVIGWHELMLTPVSLVVINHVKEVCHDARPLRTSPHYGLDILKDEFLDVTSPRLFSELIQHFEKKPMLFCCRVVAIYILELEMLKKKFEIPHPTKRSEEHVFDIPYASFILDDGSSSCCCWASPDIASRLLLLDKLVPLEDFYENKWSLNRLMAGRSIRTGRSASCPLYNILRKHNKISVKNYGSMFDSSQQDLVFSVASDKFLSCSDESFLKFIMLNACKGHLMESSAIPWQEELTESDMATKSMYNIWAVDVRSVDLQMEARSLIGELIR
ncbi:hypothetical protein Sjap_010100 [Stephania japonica]|uniref:CST complex subunit CTC1 n=1 Tax=Stephania japonica TaxID=461633 RepID=A0AAP0J8Z1_9MAGN